MKVSLRVTAGPKGVVGKEFVFEKADRFFLGRGSELVSIDDDYVSSRQFMMIVDPVACSIVDLDSLNGTLVNNKRYGGRLPPAVGIEVSKDNAKHCELKDGDVIRIGNTHLAVGIVARVGCSKCGLVVETKTPNQPVICNQCEIARRPVQPTIVTCSQCNKDEMREAGPNVHERGAVYLCKGCRKELIASPTPQAQLGKLIAAHRGAAQPKSPIPRIVGKYQFSDFEIIKQLGRGSYGIVWEVVSTKDRRPYAVKVLLPHAAMTDSLRLLFEREIKITAQLQHPNIVRIYGDGIYGPTMFYVMDLIRGTDLRAKLDSLGGKSELRVAKKLMGGALAGLGYLHRAEIVRERAGGPERVRGVVHRDLKPENILVSGETALIADCGLAKAFEGCGLRSSLTGTLSSSIGGTPAYWPREQVIAYNRLTPTSDVFSVAAVFYEMLTGVLPREGYDDAVKRLRNAHPMEQIAGWTKWCTESRIVPILKRLPNLPAPVAKVIDRALVEDEVPTTDFNPALLAKKRYADAEEFRQDLETAYREARI